MRGANHVKGQISAALALGGLLFFAAPPAARAATTYTSLLCGTGLANIPDASGSTPGSLSCVIPIFDPGTIGAGDQVTLSLIGLQHEAAADLEVTLTHFSDLAQTILFGLPQLAFSRIGKQSNDPLDFGYLPQFGDATGTGDNYHFNSSFAGDLWTTASFLSETQQILGEAQGEGQYWTTSAFSGSPNSFSSAFAGQLLAGYWRLDITDNAEGPTSGLAGSLSQFAITVDDPISAPEPAYGAVLALILSAGALVRRFR
jgi:hypothetical protein